jgi:CRP-like cAMP-binding protein
MVPIWSFATKSDSARVRDALRRADRAWQGTSFGHALHWVERAAEIAASEGLPKRAHELTDLAHKVDAEIKKRSGIPAASDPAWEEARRIQSSLIEVRDSWLDPVEVQAAPAPKGDPIVTLEDEEIIIVDDPPHAWGSDALRATVPDDEASARAKNMLTAVVGESVWQDEAATIRRETSVPLAERDTVRPPLGSLNELTLLKDFERLEVVGSPLQAPLERDPTEVIRVLRSAEVFEDLSDDKVEELARRGTLLRLAEVHALKGCEVAIILEGGVSVMENGGAESHQAGVGDSLCFGGSIADSPRPAVLATTTTSVAVGWDRQTLSDILAVCPWVVPTLRARADQLATLAAIPLRRVARRMGQSFREDFVRASRVVAVPPGTVLFEQGMEVHALLVTGVGTVLRVDETGSIEAIDPGTLLFAGELVDGAVAPCQVRAGKRGATVLHTEAVELARFLPHVPWLDRVLSEPD